MKEVTERDIIMEGEVVAKELGLVETAMTIESVVKIETKEESKDLKPSSRTVHIVLSYNICLVNFLFL